MKQLFFKKNMLQNQIYNLMAQMVEENKSLWRIKNKYLTDSADNPDCQTFFEKLAQQKEAVITELSALIQTEINQSAPPTNQQL